MNNKIAVLISGEYRTFDIAVKTMPFLQAENVDVYFSTWNKSEQTFPALNVNIVEQITVARIEAALAPKKVAGISLERHTKFDNTYRYNTKMIDRWKRGLSLIKHSRIKYEYIIVMRPDLAFRYINNEEYFHNLDDYIGRLQHGVMYTVWNTAATRNKLDDVIFIATPDTMFDGIMSVSMIEWNKSDNYDWHAWFWQHFHNISMPTEKIFPYIPVCFCRGNTLPGDNYDEIHRKSLVWRNTNIELDRIQYGDDFIRRMWGDGIFEELNQPWR